ncbi:hypothetical protein D0T50_02875 [Bacteroides sp. 214]|uniref:hypothetical protein n=1 Tax=Bacteroides sp. 214 TaxID=2302935 RepID=UPI0013D79D40|nr:hypothetical protein [Bacteroides sp. 214]NDW11830.1 hypothetical protein [Bacteroides sp. 214]
MPALIIEKRQRLIISILFRIIIIGYSIFLLFQSPTKFPWGYQILAFSIYSGVYIALHGKEKIFSFLRLFNDYFFIFFIVYQYRTLDLYSFSLLFFPILNAQNHSGEKRSILVYILPWAVVCYLHKDFILLSLIPFLFFLIINSFESQRTKYIKFHESLNSVIDNFFTQNTETQRPYKIYKECIPLLNSKPFNLEVDDIFCFKYDLLKSTLNVVNGSRFIWNFNIKIDKSTITKNLSDNDNVKSLKNIHFTINKKDINENIVFICKIGTGQYYIFILTMSAYKASLYNILGIQNKLLFPLFSRLSKVFDADLKQKMLESTKMLELGEKMNYVNSAVKAMHFIRNKLGPVKNYMSMEDDYYNSDEDKKRKIEPFLNKERSKVESSLSLVLDRANFILEKSNNPFVVSSLSKYGIQQFFSEVRRIWEEYGLTENFEIQIDTSKPIDNKIERKYVYYNRIGMDLVLTNWISNIYKYNSGNYGLKIEEKGETYTVKFYNSIKGSQPEDIFFIEQFSSLDRLEIEKRKSHGLSELKEFLTQMNIQSSMYLCDKCVVLEIVLIKTFEYEESLDI